MIGGCAIQESFGADLQFYYQNAISGSNGFNKIRDRQISRDEICLALTQLFQSLIRENVD